jgi:hypothetical protein
MKNNEYMNREKIKLIDILRKDLINVDLEDYSEFTIEDDYAWLNGPLYEKEDLEIYITPDFELVDIIHKGCDRDGGAEDLQIIIKRLSDGKLFGQMITGTLDEAYFELELTEVFPKEKTIIEYE